MPRAPHVAKPWTVLDGVIYNILSMGVIFPWAYLWGPAIFPGANVELAILLAFLAQIPISLVYSYLATAMPVNAGDYVYQRQAWGKWGFVVVFSGFVIWILQWVALAGWLFSSLGLAPLLLTLGVQFQSGSLATLGILAASPIGILCVSLLLALWTVWFLNRGIARFIKLQRILFVLTCLSVVAVAVVFMQKPPQTSAAIDRFISGLVEVLRIHVPESLRTDFVDYITRDVTPAAPKFSFLATLGVVPIAWTSLQWATYSVEQGREIRGAGALRSQLMLFVGSAAAVTLLLIGVAVAEQHAIDQRFLAASTAAYWNGSSSRYTTFFLRRVLQPFPNILAMAAAGHSLPCVIIAFGFLANAIQVSCNCFIGISRIIVEMTKDKFLPSWLLNRGNESTYTWPLVHWSYFVLSIPVIVGYCLLPEWNAFTLGVTFACGYVFLMTALAGWRLLLPGSTRSIDDPVIARAPKRLIKIVCSSAIGLALIMVCSYLFVPSLGLATPASLVVVAAVFFVSWGVTWFSSRRRSQLQQGSRSFSKLLPQDEPTL